MSPKSGEIEEYEEVEQGEDGGDSWEQEDDGEEHVGVTGEEGLDGSSPKKGYISIVLECEKSGILFLRPLRVGAERVSSPSSSS